MQVSTLTMLIELADKETAAAAEKYAHANKEWQENQHKLTMLIGYKDDYLMQFNANSKAGLTPIEYRNFQAFIVKLNEAISGQQTVVASHLQIAEACKKIWQKAQQKKMSFEVLMGHEDKKILQKENKREQKQMDEHAARMSRHQHGQ